MDRMEKLLKSNRVRLLVLALTMASLMNVMFSLRMFPESTIGGTLLKLLPNLPGIAASLLGIAAVFVGSRRALRWMGVSLLFSAILYTVLLLSRFLLSDSLTSPLPAISGGTYQTLSAWAGAPSWLTMLGCLVCDFAAWRVLRSLSLNRFSARKAGLFTLLGCVAAILGLLLDLVNLLSVPGGMGAQSGPEVFLVVWTAMKGLVKGLAAGAAVKYLRLAREE